MRVVLKSKIWSRKCWKAIIGYLLPLFFLFTKVSAVLLLGHKGKATLLHTQLAASETAQSVHCAGQVLQTCHKAYLRHFWRGRPVHKHALSSLSHSQCQVRTTFGGQHRGGQKEAKQGWGKGRVGP